MLQCWVESQSPGFALETGANQKEPVPLAEQGVVFPWFLWGVPVSLGVKKYVVSSTVHTFWEKHINVLSSQIPVSTK